MKSFGTKLKQLRIETGLSQQEACDGMPKISQTYLSALEHRIFVPRQEILTIVSDFYCVPISYWYDGTFNSKTDSEEALIKLLRDKQFDKAIKMLELLAEIEKITTPPMNPKSNEDTTS